jgi:uncharacterized radical SAM superfamily Fe-S cluster-containing enzyme
MVSIMPYPTHTQSFCTTCATVAPAQVVELENQLYLESNCPKCGLRRSLVEHDAALYQQWEEARRPNRSPEKFQTKESRGCPFDCGLCPNHHQKSCIALLEVTDACDLGCPVCYANSGTDHFLPLETIERMLDAAVESANGKPEVLQISGGEPTCHPQIMKILRAAMARPFKYVMLNTNGLALQNGGIAVSELANLGNGFEVYLQFDGLNDGIHQVLRGRPLLDEKLKTLEALAEHGIPATLVATLRRDLNLEQAGDLLRFAIKHPAVRGINFQCEAYFGRTPEQGAPAERVTQTEVVNVLSRTASELLGTENFIPLSCGLASMVYLERISNEWTPIPRVLSDAWNGNPLTTSVEELFEAAASACLCKGGAILEALSKRLPENLLTLPVEDRSKLVHERFFHITVASFLDGWNFDLNRASRECAHVLQPDGTKIPFSAYNTIYRGQRV